MSGMQEVVTWKCFSYLRAAPPTFILVSVISSPGHSDLLLSVQHEGESVVLHDPFTPAAAWSLSP